YQVKEMSYNLTDTLTGKSQPVKGLSGVAAVRKAGDLVPKDPFCAANSSPELVTAQKCTGNLSPVGRGNRDGYSNVLENCTSQYDATCGRPLLNLSVPALN